jgi:hypothetical protein
MITYFAQFRTDADYAEHEFEANMPEQAQNGYRRTAKPPANPLAIRRARHGMTSHKFSEQNSWLRFSPRASAFKESSRISLPAQRRRKRWRQDRFIPRN